MSKTKFTILQGDAVKHMRDYDEPFVDAVVTSPPYNLGIDYGSEVPDNLSRSDYINKFTVEWMTEVHRLLKPDGHLFVNLGASPANPLLPHQVVLKAVEMGWVLQNSIHWIKSITFDGKDGQKVTRGHFKPINSPRFLNDAHEYIFHFTKDGVRPIHRKVEGVGVPYSDASNIARWAHTGGENLRCGGNNWLMPYETIQSEKLQRPHPATFPVELAERCLRMAGCPKVVLDPFAGIGTTLKAAAQCEAEWAIGIDLSAAFCVAAGHRLDAKVHYA
jgi:site-specific DNA-methyltransferase (adenine-specific)